MRRYSEPYDLSSAMPHDQQTIEQTERDCRHDEQIDRGDTVGMIAEERLPPWDGGPLRLAIYLATLVCPISMPSLSSSPWIRGAPHSGLAMLISRISPRISSGTVGRPPRGRDFQPQYDLNPARCQRTMVSGLTIANASRALGNNRCRPTNINRSMALKESFFGAA